MNAIKVPEDKLKKGRTARILKFIMADLYNSLSLLNLIWFDIGEMSEVIPALGSPKLDAIKKKDIIDAIRHSYTKKWFDTVSENSMLLDKYQEIIVQRKSRATELSIGNLRLLIKNRLYESAKEYRADLENQRTEESDA